MMEVVTPADALYATILAHPDDDEPRLVYADHLEQRGELARAMLIRRQCERARLRDWDPRARELDRAIAVLLAHHGDTWRAELPELPGITWTRFERGFCSTIKIEKVADLYAVRATIPTLAPVVRVELDTLEEDDVEAPTDGLAWLRIARIGAVRSRENAPRPQHSFLELPAELELELWEGDPGEWLVERRRARPLRALTMLGEHTTGVPFVETIVDAPWLAEVETLALGTEFVDRDTGYFQDPTLRDRGADLIARAKLATVRVLSLAQQRIGDEGLARIVATMPDLVELVAARCELGPLEGLVATTGAPLAHLDLSLNQLATRRLERVLAWPRAHALASLRVHTCELQPAGIAALGAAPAWSSLRAVDLAHNALGLPGVVALLAAPPPPQLIALDLGDTDLTHEASELLADLPWLDQLVELSLADNAGGVAPKLATALAASPNLRGLDVHATDLGRPALHAFAGLWGRVRALDLSRNRVGDAGLAALVTDDESPIVELDLSRCELTPAAIATFARMRAPELRVLRLARNQLSAAFVSELLALPLAHSLEELDVSRTSLGEGLVTAVIGAGALPNLRVLRLRGHRLPRAALMVLARRRSLVHLHTLAVDGDVWQLPEDDRAELARAFGASWAWDPRPSAAYGQPYDDDE